MNESTVDVVILPDGENLTKGRLNTLRRGFDHYWRFHAKPEDWAEWCPFCSAKLIGLEKDNDGGSK